MLSLYVESKAEFLVHSKVTIFNLILRLFC